MIINCLSICFVSAFLRFVSGEDDGNSTSTIPEEGKIPKSFSALGSLQAILNKAMIVIVVLIVIIGAYLLFKFYRMKRRKAKINKYQRLHKNEELEVRDEEDNEEEVTVYEK